MPASVFVVTNRAFTKDGSTGRYRLKDVPNNKGPKELRLFEATPQDAELREWHLSIIKDRPRQQDFAAYGVQTARRRNSYRGSDLTAARVVDRLRRENKNLVVFIHGYNNNAEDALRRAWRLADRYQVEVLVFTWPANGGGDGLFEDLHGVASYRSDKSDARASTEALDRALSRLQAQLAELNEGARAEAEADAAEAHPNDRAERRERLVRLLQRRACPFRVTLLAHSMGNYLLKKTLMSSTERLSRGTIFDNVIVKAADTNHTDHALWIERLRVTRRVYIALNQDDAALRLSAMKIGDQQQPRLGNTLAEQNAAGACYIDVTPYVGDRHSYFDEADLARDAAPELTAFFQQALNGEIAEDELTYRVATNTYRIGP
jgi:esterase/lipase superfamily enzyme